MRVIRNRPEWPLGEQNLGGDQTPGHCVVAIGNFDGTGADDLLVCDEGAGVPPAQRERVFERSSR